MITRWRQSNPHANKRKWSATKAKSGEDAVTSLLCWITRVSIARVEWMIEAILLASIVLFIKAFCFKSISSLKSLDSSRDLKKQIGLMRNEFVFLRRRSRLIWLSNSKCAIIPASIIRCVLGGRKEKSQTVPTKVKTERKSIRFKSCTRISATPHVAGGSVLYASAGHRKPVGDAKSFNRAGLLNNRFLVFWKSCPISECSWFVTVHDRLLFDYLTAWLFDYLGCLLS